MRCRLSQLQKDDTIFRTPLCHATLCTREIKKPLLEGDVLIFFCSVAFLPANIYINLRPKITTR